MPPKPAQASLAGQRAIKHLIVDTGALIAAPVSSLRNTATHYLVTPDVVAELRDKRGRNVIDEARLQLPADTVEEGKERDELFRENEGFEVREPTAEAVAKITAFARKTGDLSVLSSADIRVLALCLTLELEENGTWRVRDHPGQVLTGPPKEEKEGKGKGKEAEAERLAEQVEKLEVADGEAKKEDEQATPASESSADDASAASSSTAPSAPSTSSRALDSSSAAAASTSTAEPPAANDEDAPSDAESDSSAGSWITPDNVYSHKVRDLGLFEAPSSSPSSTPSTAVRPKTIMKAAVLTGDFAMQNVALQMGLNVLGSGGKRVREVRTWVLRCHACFKLCKNPDKRFCPSCGGATLLRTSITYVPVTPQHPLGYILHLKSNYNYRLRGTQYSLPNPKMGKAGGGPNAEIVVREDQKEWIRGVRSAEVRREKEQKALRRALLDDERRAGSGAQAGTAGWFAEGGIENTKGRRGGRGGQSGEVRLDKSGLPIIGMGRRNPNEARRRK
ncbi:Nin one binding (NOB1) Zn-ribbon like-domain containing protein [Rhodotorula toruloides]|uniref:20S-pre-rRNA D-site endonuclease NOB1 n=1 Tax=Rhodotorula toruloides TaxID=5286 RepID=A0A2T0AA39_RHOTO|nr:Nin one binding (NOB1) Zn-ribbon like-domain containing protein [Rhodotorula toruloides]